MITRNGMVSMQHYNSNGCTVIMEEDKTTYTFIPKMNVSLAFVKPEHVDALLRQKARMCCGKSQNKFFLASEINTNLWQYGSRHAPEIVE